MKLIKLMLILILLTLLSGCVLTKIITVPMRVGGAVISIIPVAGNTAHDAIDKAAETVDDLPI
ncbi:MAG: hypothetical protein GY749_19790 [Desulfobacteraceae bacterium]|nr:hypothetical protein [Desulfobacteraceae bacterium]MCP4347541.1 hypothetical protein [Desulfobacterales bacterium]